MKKKNDRVENLLNNSAKSLIIQYIGILIVNKIKLKK